MKTFTKANLMRFFFFLFLVGASGCSDCSVPEYFEKVKQNPASQISDFKISLSFNDTKSEVYPDNLQPIWF